MQADMDIVGQHNSSQTFNQKRTFKNVLLFMNPAVLHKGAPAVAVARAGVPALSTGEHMGCLRCKQR